MTAGSVGAEEGVERAHYLPPARGFGNMQPSRPQPRWQRSYLHTQCLVLPPSLPSPGEPAQRWPWRFAGMAPGALAHSYQWAHCPAPAHRASAVGSPLWDTLREAASKSPAGCLWRAGIAWNSHVPHHKSLQALARLQYPGEREEGVLRVSPTEPSPQHRAERSSPTFACGWPSDVMGKQRC